MTERDSNKSRCFGFITMEDSAAINNIFEHSQHKLDNKLIECKRSIPKQIKESGKQLSKSERNNHIPKQS
jgi:RNA recognition motif-containing protein